MADDMTLMWEEVADIGSLLGELRDEEFDAPSLCTGWAVRDVLGHMGLGHTTPMPRMLSRIARYGFNVPKASGVESKTMFAGKSADDIRRFWSEVMVAQHPRKGISKMIPARSGFLDHLVHNQDIRRPTGHARVIPEARLLRALEVARADSSPFFSPKKNVAGLALHATDVAFKAGDGPLVEGPGEALVMAAAGRSAALADLTGEGVEILRSRISA